MAREVPDELLICDAVPPPVDEDDFFDRWVNEIDVEHKLCVARAALARQLQEEFRDGDQ